MSMSLFKSGDFTCISIIYMHNCGHNIPFKDVAFLWEGRLSYTLCLFQEVWHIHPASRGVAAHTAVVLRQLFYHS